jgi:hypothetical protein
MVYSIPGRGSSICQLILPPPSRRAIPGAQFRDLGREDNASKIDVLLVVLKSAWPAICMIRIGSIPAAAAFVIPVCLQSWYSRIGRSTPARPRTTFMIAAKLARPDRRPLLRVAEDEVAGIPVRTSTLVLAELLCE